MIKILMLLLMTFSFESFGKTNDASMGEKTHLTTGRRALSVGSSLFVGFGTGPALQGRSNPRSWIYGGGQVVGLLAVILTMGDCSNCNNSRDDNLANLGGVLFATSRILEILDTTYYAVTYGSAVEVKKEEGHKTSFSVLPIKDGAFTSFALSF